MPFCDFLTLSLWIWYWLLCISTSFQVLRTPESWSKHIFSAIFNPFSWKKVFWPAFGCTQDPKAGRNTQLLVKNWSSVLQSNRQVCLPLHHATSIKTGFDFLKLAFFFQKINPICFQLVNCYAACKNSIKYEESLVGLKSCFVIEFQSYFDRAESKQVYESIAFMKLRCIS